MQLPLVVFFPWLSYLGVGSVISCDGMFLNWLISDTVTWVKSHFCYSLSVASRKIHLGPKIEVRGLESYYTVKQFPYKY